MRPLIIILTFAIFTLAACEKDKIESNVIRGKVVYRSCATVVVQVLDPTYYGIAQDEWKQGVSKPTYEHVFAVGNKCAFPAMEVGTEFKFQLREDDPKSRDCVVCALWDNPPTKTNLIKVIE